MKKKTFAELNVYSMNIDDLYRLVKSTCSRASVVRSLYYDKLYKLYIQMQTNNDNMGLLINIQPGYNRTDELREMNISRVLTFEEIVREIHFYLHHHDTHKKRAARFLHQFFNSYLKSWNGNSNDYSKIYLDIISNYHDSSELFSAVTVLGIEILFSNLETMNSSCDSLSEAHNRENYLQEQAGIDIKPRVINDYLEFCNAVEEIINFVECPEINSLFASIDEIRTSYFVSSGFEREKRVELLVLEPKEKMTEQFEINLTS